jgi:ElaA protein
VPQSLPLRVTTEGISWIWKSYSELRKDELYEILKFRQEIFVVEQQSWYLDVDGLDQDALHFLGTSNNDLVAYERLLAPGAKNLHASLGRILVHEKYRGLGLGHYLVDEGMKKSKNIFPSMLITLSAQEHLEAFYNEHGFTKCGDPYVEDGIPHIEMISNG